MNSCDGDSDGDQDMVVMTVVMKPERVVEMPLLVVMVILVTVMAMLIMMVSEEQKDGGGLGIVGHTCKTSFSGGGDKGSWLEASPGKVSVRPCLKSKLRSKRARVWLKWETTSLPSRRP
jgi:hypothetical protein